ncbi:MAG: DegT/DnrJ/EryC1/StrS family aminotransferase [Methylophagaceae bacterium]
MSNKSIYITQPQLPPLEEFIPLLEQIWDSKILTNNGPIHQQLEQALCEYLGVKHIALFANGTVALMTALKVLGVKGEILTSPYTFVATTHSIKSSSCTPVFVDIDPDTLNMDPTKLEAAINERTAAILPVHCYGTRCEVEAIQGIADQHGLPVVYDAAHAFAIQDEGGSILRHGDLSILSFHATKVFNTAEGGAIVCHDAKMLERINRIKNHGFVDQITVDEIGINGKLNEISAAFGLALLPHVDNGLTLRRNIDQAYRLELQDVLGITYVPLCETTTSNYGYFPILIENSYPLTRNQLYQSLCDAEIYVRRYFYPLTSECPIYADLPSSTSVNLPVATRVSRQIICLPIFSEMTDDQFSKVITVIKENGLER